jgi:hypothetical protein
MVYLAKKGNEVVHHTSREALRDFDGIENPDMEIPDAEFEAAGCVARIVSGKIVIGKTAAEIQAEENAVRVQALKRQLADTDYIAVKIAEGVATTAEYADRIAERQAWRQEINALSA